MGVLTFLLLLLEGLRVLDRLFSLLLGLLVHAYAIHEFIVVEGPIAIDVERRKDGGRVRRQPRDEGVQVLVKQGSLQFLDRELAVVAVDAAQFFSSGG